MATDRPGSGDEHRDDHTDRPREQPPPPPPGDQQRAGDSRTRDRQAGQSRDNWESRRTGQPNQGTSRQESSSQDSRTRPQDTRSASQDTRPQAQDTRPSPQDRRAEQPSTTQQPERAAQRPERIEQQPDQSAQQPGRTEEQPDTRTRAQMDADNLRGTEPRETSPSDHNPRGDTEPPPDPRVGEARQQTANDRERGSEPSDHELRTPEPDQPQHELARTDDEQPGQAEDRDGLAPGAGQEQAPSEEQPQTSHEVPSPTRDDTPASRPDSSATEDRAESDPSAGAAASDDATQNLRADDENDGDKALPTADDSLEPDPAQVAESAASEDLNTPAAEGAEPTDATDSAGADPGNLNQAPDAAQAAGDPVPYQDLDDQVRDAIQASDGSATAAADPADLPEQPAAQESQQPADYEGLEPGSDTTSRPEDTDNEPSPAELDSARAEQEHLETDHLGSPRIEHHDGREYQITGKPEDGLWIAGMPGDPPATPGGDPYGAVKIGEYIPGDAEAQDNPKRDQFIDVLFDHADDVLDDLDHFGSGMTAIIDRGPQPTYSGTLHDHRPVMSSAPDQAVDGGHVLGAVMAVAMIGVGFRQLHDRARTRGKEGE